MEFEDMQVIWDTQNNEPLYAINEAALHQRIKRQGRRINWELNAFEWLMMVVTVGPAAYLVYDTFNDDAGLSQLVMAAIIALVGLFIFIGRRTRREDEAQFEPTLVGDIDRALARMKAMVKRQRNFIWWYGIPLFAAMLVRVIFASVSIWFLVALVVVVGAAQWGSNWEMRAKYDPQIEEMATLRAKLVDPEV